jgi:anti-sigma regulatory factor (Ser/Thr protein kinase)
VRRDDRVATAAYQPEPTAAAAARRFVRDTLRGWIVSEPAPAGRGLIDDAVLLTSELVTNAVVHAGTPVQVECRLAGGAVEVVVSDGHPARWVPEPAENEISPAERTSGRGLLLPSALASAWGVTYGPASKSVWFRLGEAVPEAVLGSAVGGGQGQSIAGRVEGAGEDRAVLAAALCTAGHQGTPAAAIAPRTGRGGRPDGDGGPGVAPGAAARPGHDSSPVGVAGPPSSRYRETLADTVEAARSAVAADAALLLMADEDGDLRPRAAAGTMPHGAASLTAAAAARVGGWPAASMQASSEPVPSVLTVPFLVDGSVSGLLAVVSAPPRRFSEAEAARLQRLADACGPPLQRAWLGELERIRRGRIGAFAEMRGLLAAGLEPAEIMTIAGHAAVPRLVPWCAVLLHSGDAGLRAAYARHADHTLGSSLGWLLEQACETAALDPSWWQRAGSGTGVRWPLAFPASNGAPAGADQLAGDIAWSFPFGGDGGQGLLVVGNGREGRLPREVAALAADLAGRVGLALASARLVSRGASG